MAKLVGLQGDFAVAEAAKLCDPDVIAAYPITPQTLIVERLSEFVADGELNASFVAVESEHSAMSACYGASAMGARVYTATASQGLVLMLEILYITSASRFPVIMTIAYRTLSGPINIHADHSDSMAARDSGWIQIYAEDCQEAYDTTLMAFKIGEHPDVSLPVMNCLDGFVLSHSIEPVELLDQKEFDDSGFLPPRDPLYALDPKNPVTVGVLALPDFFMEIKRGQQEVTLNSKKVIEEVHKEFGEKFGRSYPPFLESYQAEDADVLLVTIGSMTGTARAAVNKMRKAGKKVGLVKLRVFRPFPTEEIIEALQGAKAVSVVERNISVGSTGAGYLDIAGAMYQAKERPLLLNHIIGIGGKDITVNNFEYIADKAFEAAKKGEVEQPVEWVGVRE